MSRSTEGLVLPAEDRAELTRRVSAFKTEFRSHMRAKIILELADGSSIRQTARMAGCGMNTVRKWGRRYQACGLSGLDDLPRSGTPPTHGNDARLALVAAATAAPPHPFAAWSHDLLAEHLTRSGFSVSRAWVGRALADLELDVTRIQGWLNRTGDPEVFKARAENICRLLKYGPTDSGVIVCVDEKTSIQALERTHCDLLPSRRLRRRVEFGYHRHGVTNLICAYCHDTGAVLWAYIERNDSDAFCWFLGQVSKWVGGGKPIHLILDNGSSHVSKHTKTWLAARTRFRTHYTPPHASWLNPVELVFSALSRGALRNRSVASINELQDLIDAWLGQRESVPINWRYEWHE